VNALADRAALSAPPLRGSREPGYAGLVPFFPALALSWLDGRRAPGLVQDSVVAYLGVS